MAKIIQDDKEDNAKQEADLKSQLKKLRQALKQRDFGFKRTGVVNVD